MGTFERESGRDGRAGGEASEHAAGAGPGRSTLVEQAQAGVATGGGALPHADKIQAAFGPGHDVSSISAHVGGPAAAATQTIGAEAYATGNRVAFRSEPDLHTAAHEAAHVMQQRDGVQLLGGVGVEGDAYERNADEVADRVVAGRSAADLLPGATGRGASTGAVQMRRLPTNSTEMLTDPGDRTKPGANHAANLDGLKRLLERAEKELKPDEKTKVETEMRGGKTVEAFAKLPEDERLARKIDAINKIRPDLALGDPSLIDTGPRPATDDAKNLKKLVENATKVFDEIAAGHDKDLEDVFGKANVATARTKYANGKKWMTDLFAADKVLTDRSGYSKEVGLGGLTGFHRQIALAPQIIDKPDDPGSVVTMIHESCHAGNSDVKDKGYINQPSFTELAEDVKLKNAAHFEVVPRRILKTTFDFAGKVFEPAGTGAAPKLTPAQEAIRGASEKLRQAWTIGLNLHKLYLDVYKNPAQWDVDKGGKKYKTSLPFWSKVEKMTIHDKTSIDPASADPAKQPVSQIDMALSESCTRQLSLAMRSVPKTEADADTFEKAHSVEADRKAAHASVAEHTKFLLKLVVALPTVAPITGSTDRDLRVVDKLATLDWGTVLDKRDPGGFAD